MNDNEMKEAVLRGALSDPKSYGIRCAFCGDTDIIGAGLFIPNEEFSKLLMVPEGKQRNVVYGICAKCFELPDKSARLEEALLSDVTVQ